MLQNVKKNKNAEGILSYLIFKLILDIDAKKIINSKWNNNIESSSEENLEENLEDLLKTQRISLKEAYFIIRYNYKKLKLIPKLKKVIVSSYFTKKRLPCRNVIFLMKVFLGEKTYKMSDKFMSTLK